MISFQTYSQRRSFERQLIEDSDGKSDAYEQDFQAYPRSLHRFLPAAIRSVRTDPNLKGLEFQDKKAFKHESAFQAFEMRKLSNPGIGDVPDITGLMAPGTSTVDSPIRESISDQLPIGGNNSAVILGHPDDKVLANPIRIMRVEGEGYLARFGPRTRGNMTLPGLRVQLRAEGIPMNDIETILATLEHEGDVTYVVTDFEPSKVQEYK